MKQYKVIVADEKDTLYKGILFAINEEDVEDQIYIKSKKDRKEYRPISIVEV